MISNVPSLSPAGRSVGSTQTRRTTPEHAILLCLYNILCYYYCDSTLRLRPQICMYTCLHTCVLTMSKLAIKLIHKRLTEPCAGTSRAQARHGSWWQQTMALHKGTSLLDSVIFWKKTESFKIQHKHWLKKYIHTLIGTHCHFLQHMLKEDGARVESQYACQLFLVGESRTYG